MLGGTLGYSAYQFSRVQQQSRQSSGAPSWRSDGFVHFGLVNGDTTPDIMVSLESSSPERQFVSAFDGATGTRLWQSATTGDAGGNITHSAILSQTLLVAHSDAALVAFDVKNGVRRWDLKLNERVDKLCAVDSESFVAVTADRKRLRVKVGDGTKI